MGLIYIVEGFERLENNIILLKRRYIVISMSTEPCFLGSLLRAPLSETHMLLLKISIIKSQIVYKKGKEN